MKNWKLELESNPQDVSNNLESALTSVDGLLFDMNRGGNKSIKFKIRKRILYAWYLPYVNSIIVNGKIFKTDNNNGTDLEILFRQHFLWKLLIFIHIALGMAFLIGMILEKSNYISTYLFGVIILGLGILLWVKVQKKYERNIQEYKTLISQILGV